MFLAWELHDLAESQMGDLREVAPRDFVRLYVRIFEAWKAIINRSPYHICLGDVCRAHQLNSFCNPGSRSS